MDEPGVLYLLERGIVPHRCILRPLPVHVDGETVVSYARQLHLNGTTTSFLRGHN